MHAGNHELVIGVKAEVLAQRAARQTAPREGVDPAEFWALADQLPYRVELSWGRHTAEGRFDAVLVRRDSERPPRVCWPTFSRASAAISTRSSMIQPRKRPSA